MATFLDLVKDVRRESGMQGTGPTTVTSQLGIEEIIIRFTRDAYIDLQLLRDDFNFLEASRSFTTTTSQSTYTKLNIFGTSTPNMKRYQECSFIITDSNGKKSYLQCIDRDVLEARYLNDTQQGLPRVYAIDPSTKSIILKPIPDGVYTINFRYYENPEILTLDTQIPKIPLAYHNLIVYKALEKMAVYLVAPELSQKYAGDSEMLLRSLLRGELKPKRIRVRAFV